MSAGSELAALRRKFTLYCWRCGKRFEALKHGKWCSNRCKQQAANERKKPKERGK